jgi:VWFA-related protein
MKFRFALGLAFALVTLRGDESPQPRMLDLEVVAVDSHGQPVNDLTIEDFQVTDASRPQKIVFFRHRDSALWQVPKLAPHEVSNRGASAVPNATVILFDLMNESFGTRGSAADHITKCLQGLESAENVYLYMMTLEGRLFGVHGLADEEYTESNAATWNKQIKPLMDKALHDTLRARPVDIDVAVRVQLTFAALDALGVQLSRVPGRKNVVWVTDGVPIFLGPARSDTGEPVDFTPDLRRLSEALVRSGVALYPVRQLMLGTPSGIDETTGADAGIAAAGNRGLADRVAATDAGTGLQSLSTLNTLADMTGGRESSGKDICEALKQARTDARVSYLLGYFSPESNWDGKYHKLRVTCKRKGVRIQAKTGYFAWADRPGAGTEQAIRSMNATEFDAAEIGLSGSLSPDPNVKGKLVLTARVDAKDIALIQDGDWYNGQLSFAVVGYLADGHIESTRIFPQDLHYSAAEREKHLKDGIVLSEDVPAANQFKKVRLIVYDRNSASIGSLTLPVNP